MKQIVSLLVFSLVLCVVSSATAAFYHYYDENGQVSLTNDFKSIPERYRPGVTVVTEKELETRATAREKKVNAEKRHSPGNKAVVPVQNYVAPAPTSIAPDTDPPVFPTAAPSDKGWLALQLPLLKIIGITVVLLTAFAVIGKFITALAPRGLAILIRIALFATIAVYLFKGYSGKILDAFARLKEETNTAQKAVDQRNNSIRQQSE